MNIFTNLQCFLSLDERFLIWLTLGLLSVTVSTLPSPGSDSERLCMYSNISSAALRFANLLFFSQPVG